MPERNGYGAAALAAAADANAKANSGTPIVAVVAAQLLISLVAARAISSVVSRAAVAGYEIYSLHSVQHVLFCGVLRSRATAVLR